ncbi:hypothetical protein RCH22_002612 [Cryobacterium psychrotolerans]|nr:hypothetical protein [Cryobacterium psychrotolerans]
MGQLIEFARVLRLGPGQGAEADLVLWPELRFDRLGGDQGAQKPSLARSGGDFELFHPVSEQEIVIVVDRNEPALCSADTRIQWLSTVSTVNFNEGNPIEKACRLLSDNRADLGGICRGGIMIDHNDFKVLIALRGQAQQGVTEGFWSFSLSPQEHAEEDPALSIIRDELLRAFERVP